MLNVGDTAPEFSLRDQNNNVISLSDFLHKKAVVLFFYPKDFTPGCTAQSCSFRDATSDFEEHNAQVIGISKDSVLSHQDFSRKHSLSYPLLADVNGELAKKYKVPKTLWFLDGRATFVVDKHGKVRMAYSSQLKTGGHVTRALSAVREL